MQSNNQTPADRRSPYLIFLSGLLALIAPAISHNGFEEYHPLGVILFDCLRHFRRDWPGVLFIGANIFVYFLVIYGVMRLVVGVVRRFKG